MTNLNLIRIIYFFLSVFIISSCQTEVKNNENSATAQEEFNGQINTPNAIIGNKDELKVYPLPTPLQVATVLRSFEFSYNDTLISSKRDIVFSNSFYKSLNLGSNLIALGYSSVYNKSKLSFEYFNNVKTLMNDLNMESIVTEKIAKKFQNNLNNVDSLSKIILETYTRGNQYLKNNNQEGLGLLILTGAYIEGLYIITNSTPKNITQKRTLKNLIAQQKIFLESIIELLGFYSKNNKVAELKDKLKTLHKYFNNIEINYSDTRKKLNTNVNGKTIQKIKSEVLILRNYILG